MIHWNCSTEQNKTEYMEVKNMNHTTELPCYDRCKSFYGKAHVIYDPEKRTYTLRSYETDVIRYLPKIDEFERLWSGYSVTTMRHVNSFCAHMGHPSLGGKAWWDSLPVWPR